MAKLTPQEKGMIASTFFANIHEEITDEDMLGGKYLHYRYKNHVIPIDTSPFTHYDIDEFYYRLQCHVIDKIEELYN